ncbi:hypothetical protein [Planctomonas psychrotolerans]|uniref:hypothetical protein n=1 Tax=Planctomonas psychrotolerans TaxID=2528712 RepID=UPI001D0CF12A|nr:hypothetical protein [Planctomonas psychrotolerans]
MGNEFEPDANEERLVDLADGDEFPTVLPTVDSDERVEEEPDVDPEAPLDRDTPA